MNFTVLKDEITNDPLGRGYTGMSNVAVVVDLNTVYRPKLGSLTMSQVREWAGVNARGFNIMSGISNTALSDQQRNVCYIADKFIGTDAGELDPANNLHVGMIQELVAAGIITSADKNALVTKATINISRATELGLDRVRVGHVQDVRMKEIGL